VILTVKTLIWWNLLEKREPYREAFLYEKALKTDICAVRFALTALFSFILNTVRFALLTFLAEKRRILGKKNGTPRAKRPRA
jgi:hypothetical protein